MMRPHQVSAQQEKRYALLIGNQAYDRSVGALQNPHNDIALVAQALQKQNFEILPLVRDARRSAILGAVRELASRLRIAGPGAVAFLYYSGHGAAEKDTNINYIIPVDAKDPGSAAFWDESVKLDDIMRLLDQARGAVKFVVFDACRNELQLPTRDASKGLVPVVEQQGFFVAYASAPGRTALDRGERSGPYAAALSAELGRQGLDHLNLFQNVKETVIAATGGTQHPWESNGLTRRVYLTGEPTMPAEIALWESVRSTGDIAALRRFIDRFPDGVFAPTARHMFDRLKTEEAQREAAKRFEIERKALEAKQAAELRKALEESRKARDAVAAAEAKRQAAEKAAKEAATQKAQSAASEVRAAREAAANRDALSAADARYRAAEERLAMLEKAATANPASASEAPAGTIDERLAAIADIRMFGFMNITNTCEALKAPEVEVVSAPRFGTIDIRDGVSTANVFTRKELERCSGVKGPAKVAYYLINEQDRRRADRETVVFRVTYPAGNRVWRQEFEVDLGKRSSERKRVTATPFDGKWLASFTATSATCQNKAFTQALIIDNNELSIKTARAAMTAPVLPDGSARWTLPSVSDGRPVIYDMRLKDDEGTGTYRRVDGRCEGTFVAKKAS